MSYHMHPEKFRVMAMKSLRKTHVLPFCHLAGAILHQLELECRWKHTLQWLH
jgi:hypothetical protein